MDPVAGRKDGIPTFRQALSRKVQKSFLILHQQDSACPRRTFCSNLFRSGCYSGFLCLRQKNFECGPISRFGIDNHAAAALLRDAEDRREPQACSLSWPLGGEERLE